MFDDFEIGGFLFLLFVIGVVVGIIALAVHEGNKEEQTRIAACQHAMVVARTSADSVAVVLKCEMPEDEKTTVVPMPIIIPSDRGGPCCTREDGLDGAATRHRRPTGNARMKTPMTRRALRAMITPALRAALIEWHDGYAPMASILVRAGFKELPERQLGIERAVLIGRQIVVKSAGYERDRGDASSPKYRRSRLLCPTIKIGPGLLVQPRGRVVAKFKPNGKVRRMFDRAAALCERYFDLYDNHEFNFAYFPDRTVRCIDY
jgi:hypothetical protein